MSHDPSSCELCLQPGGAVLWRNAECRVVRVDDPFHTGFCRVIWQSHVREMTDLPPLQRASLMRVVFAVERVLRDLYAPEKINLAAFGNVVPHLHWHVIPRWSDDRHFPEPIWGSVRQPLAPARPALPDDLLSAALSAALDSEEDLS